MPTLSPPRDDEDAIAAEPWRLASPIQHLETAYPAPRSEAGHQLEVLLKNFYERFSATATVLKVHVMRVTGEHAAIQILPNYDLGGLEADSEFTSSFTEAVERGRRFEADMRTDWAEIDVDY